MEIFIDSDWLRGEQFSQNLVPKRKYLGSQNKRDKFCTDLRFEFCMSKTSIELLCESNEQVSY